MIAIPVFEVRSAASREGRATSGQVDAVEEMIRLGFRAVQIRAAGRESTADAITLIEQVSRSWGGEVFAGGCAADEDDAERFLGAGATKLVVEGHAIDDADSLGNLAVAYPGTLVVESAVGRRQVKAAGRVRTLAVDVFDLVEELASLPLGGLMISSINLDPASRGRTLAMIEEVAAEAPFPVLVNGSVRDGDDLDALEHRGVAAAALRCEMFNGLLDPRTVARAFSD